MGPLGADKNFTTRPWARGFGRHRVYIQRHSAVCVTQALLHDLHVFAIRLQQHCKRMPERVPADVFDDPCTHGARPNSLSHCAVGPVRLLAQLLRAGEHSVLIAVVGRSSTPVKQNFRQSRIERNWLARRFGIDVPHYTIDDRAAEMNFSAPKTTSCHFIPRISLTRSPVVAATKTIVQNGSFSSDNSALVSSTSRTSGVRAVQVLSETAREVRNLPAISFPTRSRGRLAGGHRTTNFPLPTVFHGRPEEVVAAITDLDDAAGVTNHGDC